MKLPIDRMAAEREDDAEPQAQLDARKARDRMERLHAIAVVLAGALTTEDIAAAVVDTGVEAIGADIAGMWLIPPEADHAELVRARGLHPSHADVFVRVPLAGDSPLGETLRTGTSVWLASRAEYAARYPVYEAEHRPAPSPPLALACVPLIVAGRVAGGLSFVFHRERAFEPDERTFLELLARHCAQTLERARLYETLQELSETRAAIIQASPAAIVLLDPDGTVRMWNPAAERIFGWTEPEVLGCPLPTVPDDRRGELARHLQHVTAGHTVLGEELRRQRADGQPVDVQVWAAPVRRSDGSVHCLSVYADITERKRAERTRQLLADAGAILAEPASAEDILDRVVRLPVPAVADWCCIDLLRGDGTLQRIAMSSDPDAGGAIMPRRLRPRPGAAGVAALLATGEPQMARDVTDEILPEIACNAAHLAALRALRIRSWVSAPLAVGRRLIGAFTFISSVRNFDEVDLEVAVELSRRVALAAENARLYRETARARSDAEAASRTKDQFLAMLGHELRNPLSPILTALQLMSLRGPRHFERERTVIQRQVQHLTRLVDDLLDISRITGGKIELQRERLELAEVVGKSIELTSPLIEQRRHHLDVRVPPTGLAVHGDHVRLAQVVGNLLVNAAKYTEPGGHIRISAERRDDQVVLRVRDSGVGIAPELLPVIFDMFMQGSRSLDRAQGGLGLGLTIVRQLVELHGGTVSAHSEGPGTGSELTVTLPAATGATDEAATPLARGAQTRAARTRGGPLVLVVDDNADAAELLAELLHELGYATRVAGDGLAALALARESTPALAFLDIGLPVMDGYELAGRLRALAGRQLRLVAVTGYGQAHDRRRALGAGFDEHLVKPVSLDDILRVIRQERGALG